MVVVALVVAVVGLVFDSLELVLLELVMVLVLELVVTID